MASTPVGNSGSGQSPSWASKTRARSAKASSNSATASASDAAQAGHDAGEQIARSEQAVQDAQNESNVQLEHIQDGFEQEETNQTEKNEQALAKQRQKGYEELRDLKQRQRAELGRVRRDGETNLKQTGDYYRDTLYKNSMKNEDALRQQQAAQAREMQFVTSTGKSDAAAENADSARKKEALHHLHEQQIGELTKSNAKEYERMKNNSTVARQQEAAKFQGEFDTVLSQDHQALDNLQNNASRQLRELRQDTSQKLAAYSSRQSDPFYKMLDIGAELHDRGDAYVLTARIPSQEQAHVSATVRGNTLVISGSRRNEEHLTLGPGRSRGTSAYQSYEESFPLAWPVDRNALTKEFHGDQVIITVPKAKQGEFHEGYHPRQQPERVRAERPDFPGNLPLPEDLATDSGPTEGGRKPIAGHTLS